MGWDGIEGEGAGVHTVNLHCERSWECNDWYLDM